MNELFGKKLLILGANPETVPLVEVANSLGVKTIVTSNVKDDLAKRFSWKSYDVNCTDVDKVIELARIEKVDGILVGVADVLVPYYQKICEKLNLPCYANKDSISAFCYKDIFKRTCEKYGIMGIPEYHLDESMSENDIEQIVFPVMVKPVDNGSGTGMTLCYNKYELKSAVDKALASSKNKRFIVERFMKNCPDVGIYYSFKDGECHLSAIFDRYTCDFQKGVSKVNMCSVYPSKFIDVYYSKMHSKALKMFSDLNIENGVLLITAFYENGEFYVYDPGFRFQGEAPHLLVKNINGYDQREMMIRFALTGSGGNFPLSKYEDASFKGKKAATLWILLKSGKITRIEGMNEIENDHRIKNIITRFNVGDVICDNWIGTEKQVFTRLYLVCDNLIELRDLIYKCVNDIKVFDEDNENMCITKIDLKNIE